MHFYVPLLWLWSLNLDLAQQVENANIWLAVKWDINISENAVAYLVDLTWVKSVSSLHWTLFHAGIILEFKYILLHVQGRIQNSCHNDRGWAVVERLKTTPTFVVWAAKYLMAKVPHIIQKFALCSSALTKDLVPVLANKRHSKRIFTFVKW